MVRICKIITDLPLEPSPLAPQGIIEFCEVCKKCARACPSHAISDGGRTYEGVTESNNPGVLKWYTDPDRCLELWNEVGTGCSICFR
ncbi:MAG: 4Fe-4S double cluster binding domain-containing protein, partial [Candidatus Bathyarchaeia archaeon]